MWSAGHSSFHQHPALEQRHSPPIFLFVKWVNPEFPILPPYSLSLLSSLVHLSSSFPYFLGSDLIQPCIPVLAPIAVRQWSYILQSFISCTSLIKCWLASSQAGCIGGATRQKVEAGQPEQENSGKKKGALCSHNPETEEEDENASLIKDTKPCG